MRGFAVLAVLALFVCAYAVPSDYISKSNAKSITDAINEQRDKSGSAYNANIGDTHYAVKTHSYLGQAVPDKQKLCPFALKGLEGDIESIYHSVQVIKAVGCKVKAAPANVAKVVAEAVQGESLLDYYHAVSTVYTLGKQLQLKKSDVLPVAANIMDLMDGDQGTFKRTPQQDEGSVYYAGLAYTALSLMYKDLGQDEKDQVSGVFDQIETLLSLAEEDSTDSAASFSHQDNTVSSLKTTSTMLQGVLDISKALNNDPPISEDLIVQLAQYFVNNKHTTSISEAAALTGGLKNCNGKQLAKPVVLSVARGTIHVSSKGEEGYVQVRATDVFGAPVPAKVYLVSAYSVQDKSKARILSNQEAQPVKGDKTGLFSLNFLAAKPDPGAYIMEFRVTPKKDSKWQAVEVERTIKVQTQIVVDKPEIMVTDTPSATTGGRTYELTKGKTLKDTVSVASSQFLHLRFKISNKASGRSILVHQAFVKFTNVKTQEEQYFVARASKSKQYDVRVNLAKDGAKFNNRDGKYEMTLIVGDSYIDNSFQWKVATVSLSFDGEATELPKTTVKTVRPEIKHKFAVPEKRAPRYLSDAFTIAVLVQLLFLLIGFVVVGINLRNFPLGLNTIFALGFHGCLAAWLALYAAYWLYIDFFEATRYMLVLAPLTVFFGHRTLRHIATQTKRD